MGQSCIALQRSVGATFKHSASDFFIQCIRILCLDICVEGHGTTVTVSSFKAVFLVFVGAVLEVLFWSFSYLVNKVTQKVPLANATQCG